ncbi:hypothetical protein XNC1_0781 [Xenorhabdus nematophila ATCC 19061]|uniref:Uncharacterized protein n=1 Tax=Xenorhabdus nematophila (strain ATCC 19061 / DSM 3370 / CCUG 14189 / LMG 1036 / NCIMB 9965 / AN6) TaxID=406817 RepID=D3VKA0_XENNA|nr:hypothetical protein XNC1_0781 [Xenorhabdus nematophila ATCC 19061]
MGLCIHFCKGNFPGIFQFFLIRVRTSTDDISDPGKKILHNIYPKNRFPCDDTQIIRDGMAFQCGCCCIFHNRSPFDITSLFSWHSGGLICHLSWLYYLEKLKRETWQAYFATVPYKTTLVLDFIVLYTDDGNYFLIRKYE